MFVVVFVVVAIVDNDVLILGFVVVDEHSATFFSRLERSDGSTWGRMDDRPGRS